MKTHLHQTICGAMDDMRISAEDITATVNGAQWLNDKQRNTIRRNAVNILAALQGYEEASGLPVVKGGALDLLKRS